MEERGGGGVGEGGMGVINLSSTRSPRLAARCEVSTSRYPIAHIYYAHRSDSLFWQLCGQRTKKTQKESQKEGERG